MYSDASEAEIEANLLAMPEARIRVIVDHKPILSPRMLYQIKQRETSLGIIANRQRIQDYIDDFGRYVYVQTLLDLDGNQPDEDRRYLGVADPPKEYINTEDYDLCSRLSASERSVSFKQLYNIPVLDNSTD